MIDTDQILVRMDEGFSKLHERLNELAKESAIRQLGCAARFGNIEQQLAIKSAVGIVEKAGIAKTEAFRSALQITVWGTIIVGILVIIWKIFLGHIDLIVK